MKNKFKPYIRKANGKERSKSFRGAMRLAFYQELKKPFYVMVQRGFPNLVIGVGSSRYAIEQGILPIWEKRMSFKEWAQRIKRRAQGKMGRA